MWKYRFVMTEWKFYKGSCTRCGAITYCIEMEGLQFCEACFDIMSNDKETAHLITRLCDRIGIKNLEN